MQDGREAARLLLVEDEFLIRLTLTEALGEDGYEVVDVADADAALACLDDAGPFSMLLTDVQLPGSINGHELAGRVRERYPEMPVIFMTGRPEPGPGGLGRRDLIVAKPYLPSELCAAVGRLLAA